MVGQNHRLNTRFIQRQFRALGNTVTVVEVARTFPNEAYREVNETYTNHTDIYTLVSILTEQDTSVQEGEARAGDLIFNFDYSSEAFLKQGNRIIFDGRTFQISDVRRFDAIGNTTYMIECLTKKYSDGTNWLTTLTETLEVSGPVKKMTENAILIDTCLKYINKDLTEVIEFSDEFTN